MTVPKTAIVIDDLEGSREATVELLARCGLAVLVAAPHGIESGKLVETHVPDLVFVAVEQPVQRALRTIEYVNGLNPDRAVIGYSALTELSVFQQAVRAGARHLLEGPLKQTDVERVLRTVAGREVRGADGRPAGRVLAIVGQKGGIGKTAISVNLAAALAHGTRGSVLIIDFDMSFGDVALAMDVEGLTTTARAAAYVDTLDRETFKSNLIEHVSGAWVLPAPAQFGEWLTVEPEALESLVNFAAEMFDYVIIDTPGAFNDAVAAAIAIADHLLIITSMERTSIKNTGMLLDVLMEEGYPDERTLVIANQTQPNAGVDVTEVAPALGRTSMWEVPFEEQMRMASQEGRPLVLRNPDTAASQSLRTLAHRIATEPDRIDRRKEVRAARAIEIPRFRKRLGKALAGMKLAKAS